MKKKILLIASLLCIGAAIAVPFLPAAPPPAAPTCTYGANGRVRNNNYDGNLLRLDSFMMNGGVPIVGVIGTGDVFDSIREYTNQTQYALNDPISGGSLFYDPVNEASYLAELTLVATSPSVHPQYESVLGDAMYNQGQNGWNLGILADASTNSIVPDLNSMNANISSIRTNTQNTATINGKILTATDSIKYMSVYTVSYQVTLGIAGTYSAPAGDICVSALVTASGARATGAMLAGSPVFEIGLCTGQVTPATYLQTYKPIVNSTRTFTAATTAITLYFVTLN